MHKKVVLLSLVTAGVLACSAQKAKTPYWLDPSMNRVHKRAIRRSRRVTSRLRVSGNSPLQRTTTKPRKTSLSRVTTTLRGKTSQYLDCSNSMVMAMPFIVM